MLKLIKDLGRIYPNKNSKCKSKYGIYKCFCGKEFRARTDHIKSNKIKSCGCTRFKKKHGNTNHPIYKTWVKIKQRCYNPNTNNYHNYGGRGITVCEEWKNSFDKFYNDMINSWNNSLTLDRIDVNKGYFKENCRWADMSVQNCNQRIRSTNNSGFIGISYSKRDNIWRSQLKFKGERLLDKCFKNKTDAVIYRDNFIIKNNLPHPLNIKDKYIIDQEDLN